MNKRILAKTLLIGALGLHLHAYAAAPTIEVYKTASCGCCGAWVKHLQENGFTVQARNVDSPADYREKFGIPQQFGSCHTGYVNGYAIEGHVPAVDIRRLLAEKPKAQGLAVPAMPLGSPGMEGPRRDPYDVFLIKADGKHSVFAHHE